MIDYRLSSWKCPAVLVTALAAIFGSSGCNVFDPFDNPGGDTQLLSAARACLDRQDYVCALEYYGKLSDDKKNTRLSEEAYTILDQNGAGFETYASSLGSNPNGKGLTAMANKMVSGAGETRRLAIYSAYQKVAQMTATTTGDAALQSLTRFLTASALAAEIMAEGSGNDGIFTATDLAASASCNDTQGGACISSACNAGTGNITNSSTNGDIKTSTPSGTYPSLDQLYTAIDEAYTGLSGLGASSSSTGAFGSLFDTGQGTGLPSASAPQAQCFRAALISQGIGG